SENELLIPVHVLRPFYLRWPFLLLLTALLLGLAWGIGNWRARQLRKANLTLEEEVRKRTRQIESDKQLIEQQARELRSLDETKSRFFANITHELRTPLALIFGPAENLLKLENLGERSKEHIYNILRSSTKLLNLVEELLDLSRMEANKLVVNEKPVWLHQFLSRTLATFTPYSEHRGITMKLDFRCPEDVILLMDVQKWEKIINNLLNNAMKFTPLGGRITLTAGLSGDELIISVEDTGMGIPPEDLPYIFDRYYQVRTAENAQLGGAGIGLSLCREYIRLFGGEITAESTPGEGSRFTLRCPSGRTQEHLQTPVVEEPVFTGISELTEKVSHDTSRRTVLLVEDNKDMSDYIRGILNTDYNLLIADNGVRALHILEKTPVDLVLSDLMMPEMDGLQLLKTVRERYQDLPFIMLTARADAPDRLNALTLGVDDYLTKPFMEEELLARLKNLIGRYDARKVAQAQTDITGIEMKFDQKWLMELEQAVNDHLGNPDFSLDELADILQISRRSLYNKTVTFTGLTPSQYLLEARLTMGRRLLASGGHKTLAEVCYAVGMKTPDYFSKLMKERFG
ncbi:MAG: response regulator, partial [Bacteroidota bacterium]